MAGKFTQPVQADSQIAKAMVIYRKFLKQVEDGEFDESKGWRATVLAAFERGFISAKSSHSPLFATCQKRVGRKVNKYFEIVPTDDSAADAEVGSVGTVVPSKPTPKQASRTGPLKELELVPKQGPTVKSSVTPAPVTSPIEAATPPDTPTTPPEKSAREKAQKVHSDLIDLCTDEISEAFSDLGELIDTVDQAGDAKVLRTFVRRVKAACKKIEDQLATKAKMDRMQTNRILVGLKA